MNSRLFTLIGVIAALLLAACGGAAPAPASSAPAGSAAAKTSAAAASPATSAAAGAKPSVSAKPSIAPAPPGTILAAYSELTPINTPLWAAVDTGIFKKNGLTVDARLIESSLGVGALLSDEVKFAAMGGSEALAATVEGADLVVLLTLSPVYPYKLEVRNDIKTAQDLKGKKLGISRIGSSSDSATRAALRKLGLDADKDVQLIQVGSLAARMAALTSGALDGAVAALPDT
ncbi:MAG TPA: ABC transporter substrate-binding protein, partial [Chloroflexota bacterium]|nr:ABC transporter substrate-binding protein [Chloroflexota bacterium]